MAAAWNSRKQRTKQKMGRRFVAQAAREPVRASQIWEQNWLVSMVSRHSGYAGE